ncbi:MAG: hypothetical protein ABWZ25_16965 [Chitinophagaceae bacterium]
MPNQMDLNKFKNVLPYASELFGVYQPLLGWKSKRMIKRFHSGVKDSQLKIVDTLLSKMYPDTELKVNDFSNNDIHFDILKFNAGTLNLPNRTNVPGPYRFFITDLIQKQINREKMDKTNIKIWKKLVSEEAMKDLLPEVKTLLQQEHTSFINNVIPVDQRIDFNLPERQAQVSEILNNRIELESSMAGVLNELFKQEKFEILAKIFFPEENVIDINQIDEMTVFLDPMENFDPKSEIGRVSLSPVGIVHLFRQYFFEFDTFLGQPVEHIWLSPGASLELIEIHTRKQIIESAFESSFESIHKTEESATTEDDVSDAVRSENQNNTKFGMSASAGGSVQGGVPNVYSATGHVDTTTSYGLENNEKTAKEHVDKLMKQQSHKISTEIRKNFKTSFKTTTETQHTSSKRYVLQNTTQDLINYELRRKMRQVGVQVQDIGTNLCWQTYVDMPGHDLGLAKLVHIAEPPNLSGLPHPEQGAIPQPISKDYTLKLPLKDWWSDDRDTQLYVEHPPVPGGPPYNDKGGAINSNFDGDYIHMNYEDNKVEEIPGYNLTQVVFDGCVEGKLVEPVFYEYKKSAFNIHLRKVKFDGYELTLKLKLIYSPEQAVLDAIDAKYKADLAKYDTEKAKLAKEAFVREARDRIKVASNIKPRKFEELREEERTIIYRYLIGDLLKVGVDMSNSQTRHVLAELINSMFDIDKMLYFTAPEWWMPRSHSKSFQDVGKTIVPSPVGFGRTKVVPPFTSEDIVSWGGAAENYRPNYFITEDSTPAKLGSSLGWLLQLDGDNIRNAFLNAPWVKAVIPIKPGKELAALNWLMKANVEGADGIQSKYQEGSKKELDDIILFLEKYPFDASDPRQKRYKNFSTKINNDPANFFVTIEDALISLSLEIKTKYENSKKPVTETIDGETKRYLPTDKVYEHGFDPLQGGFQVETDVQFALGGPWVEVLPTDQIVAVEVKYDPKTGRQI